jgi:hypothetical protein
VNSLAEPTNEVVEAVERLAGALGTTGSESIQMREIMGLDKALRSIRGEMQNNLAKLGEVDAGIAKEETKLKQAEDLDEVTRNRVEEWLHDLRLERDARLEALSTNRTALRSQVTRIRETIAKMLHEDTTLAEWVKTLFREQGITIVSILTALGMTISSLVAWLPGGGGGTLAPTPCLRMARAVSRSGSSASSRPSSAFSEGWPKKPRLRSRVSSEVSSRGFSQHSARRPSCWLRIRGPLS